MKGEGYCQAISAFLPQLTCYTLHDKVFILNALDSFKIHRFYARNVIWFTLKQKTSKQRHPHILYTLYPSWTPISLGKSTHTGLGCKP